MGFAGTFLALVMVLAAGACSDPGTLSDAPVPDPEDGNLVVTWTIENNGAPAQCADVGAQLVRVEVIGTGQGAGLVDAVPCSLGALTMELAPSTYDVTLALVSPTPNAPDLATTTAADVAVASSQDTNQAFTFSLGE